MPSCLQLAACWCFPGFGLSFGPYSSSALPGMTWIAPKPFTARFAASLGVFQGTQGGASWVSPGDAEERILWVWMWSPGPPSGDVRCWDGFDMV